MLAGTLLAMLTHPWGWRERQEDAFTATRKIMQTWDDHLRQVEEEERQKAEQAAGERKAAP